MADIKKYGVYNSSTALFLLIILMITLVAEIKTVRSQNCVAEINSLNVCAPFVVPGQADNTPSAECCNALQQVNQGCLCSTIRISSRIPVACRLPPLSCGNFNFFFSFFFN